MGKAQKIKFGQYQAKLLYPLPEETAIRQVETCARICYRSKSDDIEKAGDFLKKLWNNEHHSIFEHVVLTCFIKCDRALMFELTRHRLASFSVESTRYVAYDNEIEFILPSDTRGHDEDYRAAAEIVANTYRDGLGNGQAAQTARAYLPNMLATRLYMTANLREWMHVFKLRWANRGAHPDMRVLMGKVAEEFLTEYPILFGEVMGLSAMKDEVCHPDMQ